MQWAAPLWLLGLIPWTALTIWLCLGKLAGSGVPFLPLWQGTALHRKTKRQLQWPPLAIICALAAMLLGILAAAQPIARRFGGSVIVILDRGVSMSADHQGKPRFVEAAERLVHYSSKAASVRLVDPLANETEQQTGSAWLDAVRSRSRTAIDTKTLLPTAIARELSQGQEPVIVLTDRALAITNPRLTVITPSNRAEDVGITSIAARSLPTTQIMVGIRNQSALRQTVLKISSGDQTVEKKIDLPSAGQIANYFIDMPSLGEIVEARLLVQDDLPADDVASLVRGVQPMRLEVRGLIGKDLQRLVEVYGRVKSQAADSSVAAIVNDTSQLSASAPGVIVSTSNQPLVTGDLKVTTDPLTTVVYWNAAVLGAGVSKPPQGDWNPLVTVGGVMLVGKRESPGRQVWVGFSNSEWPKSPDFVVFWTNVLNWVAGNAAQWTAVPVQQLSGAWKAIVPPPANVQPGAWPGVYSNGTTVMAMNCAVPDFSGEVTSAPSAIHVTPGTSEHSWSSYLLVAAIGCLVIAAMVFARG